MQPACSARSGATAKRPGSLPGFFLGHSICFQSALMFPKALNRSSRGAIFVNRYKGAQLLSPRKTAFAAIVFFGAFFASHAIAQEKSIVVASSTSTQDSGLFDYLLPLFTQKTGIAVKVLAQGTGQAL